VTALTGRRHFARIFYNIIRGQAGFPVLQKRHGDEMFRYQAVAVSDAAAVFSAYDCAQKCIYIIVLNYYNMY